MLRAVRLDNFVNFHKDCNFSFHQDGAHFFVGQNGSGKSSVFEAIRRCLSRNSNTSFSRMPDETKPTYIICEYEIPDPSLFYDCKKVFTSFVHIPEAQSKYKYAKIVLLDDLNEVYIELFERTNTYVDMKYRRCSFQTEIEQQVREEICKHLPSCTSDRNYNSIQTLQTCLQKLLEVKNEDTGTGETVDETLDAEAILRELEKSIVFTFALRSLGPLQWSKSKLITINERENNYRSAREKSEIIRYFLSDKDSKKYDIQKEDKIFKMLTDHASYSFGLENDEVTVKLDGKFVEVLKISEGILEAKYLSLLLASEEFFTVLLEEPDRGMHPQMIHMIRDIVLPQVEGKTIIIVTHNPILIASWSIPRTYKFYKKQVGDILTSIVVPVGSVAEKNKNKIPRLLATEDYVSMIFARKVIFVEGQSDFYFVKAVLEHILNPLNEKSTLTVLDLASSEETTNTQDGTIDKLSQIRTFLASLHVVKLSGEKSKNKWQLISKKLGLSALFLLDRDAVVQVQIVDTCDRAAEIIKGEIKNLVSKAFNSKKGKNEVKSQNTQQIPNFQNTQENLDSETEAMTVDLQQPRPDVVEPEQGKQKKNKYQDEQGNTNLANLITDITETMINNFCNQKYTVNESKKDEHKGSISLKSAKEKMKEVIEKIVSRSDSWNDLERILNEDDKSNCLQYFRSVYEDLLDNTSDKIPTSTILHHSILENDVVSNPIKTSFEKFVTENKWEEARKCLEEEGVFVWRSGNLEDALIDLVINFECADAHTRHAEMFRRRLSFSRHGIDLNLTRLSTRKQTKLFMDDKVSDENISEIIVLAFSLCGKKSDITQFIRFLMCKRSD